MNENFSAGPKLFLNRESIHFRDMEIKLAQELVEGNHTAIQPLKPCKAT